MTMEKQELQNKRWSYFISLFSKPKEAAQWKK